MRTSLVVASIVGLLAALPLAAACSPSSAKPPLSCSNGQQDGDETGIDCGGSCHVECSRDGTEPNSAASNNGVKDNGETDIDCGGPSAPPCDDGKACLLDSDCASGFCPEESKICGESRSDDGIRNGLETDVDCGGPNAPTCAEGKACLVDSDCGGACNYANRCVDAPSCKPHLGGDTCGKGEIDQSDAAHESCCKSLPVAGYVDPTRPDRTVYLDKYEITSGRVRAFIEAITTLYDGKPNIRAWVSQNVPPIWDSSWNKFLPTDREGETVRVDRRLLGDPRGGDDGPPIPTYDQDREVGINYQFNGQLFVYLHGNNCSTHAPTAYGFPTFFYPADVLAKMGPEFPPRADGQTLSGTLVPASEHLEVKSMNCITNALLAAFCHWDGGQLATNEVLDYVTGSPSSLGSRPGCGTQIGTEDPPSSSSATRGGRCADLSLINATYDAGASLPVPNSPLNVNNYMYPFFPDSVRHDKAWQISAPGRGSRAANGEQVDMVRIHPDDEPWMDLAGNLNEAVLEMSGGTFTGRFGLKYRGVGYNSARSLLNFKLDWEGEGGLRRIERPEARAGFTGGRCMRFK